MDTIERELISCFGGFLYHQKCSDKLNLKDSPLTRPNIAYCNPFKLKIIMLGSFETEAKCNFKEITIKAKIQLIGMVFTRKSFINQNLIESVFF